MKRSYKTIVYDHQRRERVLYYDDDYNEIKLNIVQRLIRKFKVFRNKEERFTTESYTDYEIISTKRENV